MSRKPPSRVELILRTLLAGPGHGHAIAKHIRRTSEDLLQVETGSLYPALHRLEARGWIAASWELSDKGKRARYYRLTPIGRKQLATGQSKWQAFSRAMGLILNPVDQEGQRNSFFRKLSWLTQRRRREDEFREELQFHRDEEAEQRQIAGLAKDQARWAARRELGNRSLVEEDTRALWGWTIVEQLGQDLRYAFRAMAANRLFTLLAVSSLALGIGANTAIYSFMDAILLRAPPVSDPESLVALNWRAKAVPRDDFGRREG